MKACLPILTIFFLLGLASSAHANVPRTYYEDDQGYANAKVQIIALNVLLCVTPILGLFWMGYRSRHSKSGTIVSLFKTIGRLIVLLAFLFFLMCQHPNFASGGIYFVSGNHPDFQRGRSVPPEHMSRVQSLAVETSVGVVVTLVVVFGGFWLVRYLEPKRDLSGP